MQIMFTTTAMEIDEEQVNRCLGHEHISTTQMYTHMTLDRLKDVHNRTHPSGDGPSKPTDNDQAK